MPVFSKNLFHFEVIVRIGSDNPSGLVIGRFILFGKKKVVSIFGVYPIECFFEAYVTLAFL